MQISVRFLKFIGLHRYRLKLCLMLIVCATFRLWRAAHRICGHRSPRVIRALSLSISISQSASRRIFVSTKDGKLNGVDLQPVYGTGAASGHNTLTDLLKLFVGMEDVTPETLRSKLRTAIGFVAIDHLE